MFARGTGNRREKSILGFRMERTPFSGVLLATDECWLGSLLRDLLRLRLMQDQAVADIACRRELSTDRHADNLRNR